MLFTAPTLAPDEKRALERVAHLRHELRSYVVLQPRRWTGLLRA